MKNIHIPFIISLFLCLSACANPRANKTSGNQSSGSANEPVTDTTGAPGVSNANTKPNKYTGYFLFGSNMAYKNSNWTDEDVADILVGNPQKNLEGVGANSLRPALYEDYLETYGYDFRVKTFDYYSRLGAKINVAFIGDRPSDTHRERKQYVSGTPSESYENLYEPIWDDGANGTPVNDKNYFALFVYKVVQRYKTNVKFWEIKNEPDFVYGPCGDYLSGRGCNWWDNDPSPESLVNLHAPIQSYIRMLRISYEVIKSVDPDAFICLGGIGYVSFMDAILRNTDNPDGGKITTQYPYKGGAWFDCLSYHIYPMYKLRSWSGAGFKYFRHSDAATDVVVKQNDLFVDLLKKYGYDGEKYPEKEIIITETNVSNKHVDEYIGSETAQRNYLLKIAVVAQRNKISGIYPYCPWDFKEWDEKGTEYDYKGFYKPIPEVPGADLRMHEGGVAWRTASRTLASRRYDAAESAKLALPAGVDGGAFHSAAANDYVYVLWAKTSKDMDETTAATYSFPATLNVKKLAVTEWNETQSAIEGNTIRLTGSPVFVKINESIALPVAATGISMSQNSASIELNKSLQLTATVLPENAKNKTILWSSDNPRIAMVNKLGRVLALTVGTTTITAKTEDGSKTATCGITVTPLYIPMSYIMLSSSYETMKAGGTTQLKVNFYPENTANQKIVWKSSDEKIVSVDKEGKLKALASGKVTITATPDDDNSKAKSCIVQVN